MPMKPENYKKRFYRLWQTPDDLVGFNITYRESDINIFADKNLKDQAKTFLLECRKPIEDTIKSYPDFITSLKPIKLSSGYKIITTMIEASQKAGVGPMAGVAGAIAQCIGIKLSSLSREVIVENGGDIWINSKKERIMLVYAGEESPFKDKLKIRLKPRQKPYGVCTSSRKIGHSLNFGWTDATVVIADSAITADVYATAISNMVKSESDIESTVEYCAGIEDLIGGIILIGKKIGVWGDIEFA